MEKILVNIVVPSVGKNYDAFVPQDIPVCELTVLIADSISELSEQKYTVSGNEMLCLKETDGLLNPFLTLSDYNIMDAMHLYLI